MANATHLEKLAQGVDAWNDWARTTHDWRIDLSNTDLSNRELAGIHLVGAYMHGSNLDRTSLYEANLLGADLTETSLRGANLSSSDLTNADLSRADLRGADLSKSNLIRAKATEARLGAALLETNLCWADLTGSDFQGAQFGATILGDTNLSKAGNLDLSAHLLPSIIDHQTLTKSGQLPTKFLQGCGLPDSLVEYLPSLSSPIQFYSCVISYSTSDQEFAKKLHADLTRAGIRSWIAAQDLRIGEQFAKEISRAIHFYDKMLVVLSQSSVRSRWVEREIVIARQKERKEHSRVLFPVRLDNEVMTATSPVLTQVREYHIGDFRDWKNRDSYQHALSRLIRDLTFSLTPEGNR